MGDCDERDADWQFDATGARMSPIRFDATCAATSGGDFT
jgi:hypothetical protein